MPKRLSVIVVLALVLVFSMATAVLAAQNVEYSGSAQDGTNDFAATPKVFSPDGTTNYPNEIYLPNENPVQKRIHTNYEATTDACASCHSTHTAVGEALLQWGSVTDTCNACHDGTVTTTYNVKSGLIGNTTMPSSAGLFETDTANSGSSHNVSGALSVYAAPGGPGTPGVEAPSWETEFGCQSCHSPHGMGGNARILNPDVNGYASAAYAKGNYSLDAKGNNIGGSKNVPLTLDSDGTYYSNWQNKSGAKDQWLWSGYPYSKNVAVYVNGNKKVIDTDYTLNNTAGFTKVTFKPGVIGSSAAVTADFMPALVVKMNITNYLQGTESVQHVAGLNDFCGACHTDYNTSGVDAPHANLNGTYTEAYRHKVGFDRSSKEAALAKLNMKLESGKVTCETCHVAHGTDSQYWVDSLKLSNGGTLPTGFEAPNLQELSGSSALKRLPNMATCEACHAKGVASQGYTANSGVTISNVPGTTVSSTVPGGGYVGQQACKSCHGNVSEHYAETWHPSMTRPGVTKVTWDSVKSSLVNADGTFNTANAAALDAKSIDGFAQALYTTMVELEGKNMFDAKGAIVTDPAVWNAKGIDTTKIQVWTTGTTKQEIAVRGSAIGKPAGDADKWFIVTYWGRGAAPNDFTQAEEENYTCGTAPYGCHTTGKAFDNGSVDWTTWLNAAVTGTQPFELGITCEACHGQGGNHVKTPSAKNIVNPANFTPVEQTVGLGATKVNGYWTANGASKLLNSTSMALACGKCHSGGRHQGDYYSSGKYADTLTNKTFTPSEHFTSGLVSCNSCHDTHQESKGLVAYATTQLTCESCHGKLANFNLSTYMPALERDADLHQHDFKTGEIPNAGPQSNEGRRTP